MTCCARDLRTCELHTVFFYSEPQRKDDGVLRFPNRYADYLQRCELSDARKGLELSGILSRGRVDPRYILEPDLPSAPLRAFNYTEAGGGKTCGKHINAVFK